MGFCFLAFKIHLMKSVSCQKVTPETTTTPLCFGDYCEEMEGRADDARGTSVFQVASEEHGVSRRVMDF